MDLNFVCFSSFKQVLSGIHAVLNKLISVLILMIQMIIFCFFVYCDTAALFDEKAISF